jgi:hypothetical protein
MSHGEPSQGEPLKIGTGGRLKPTCPRCGSTMILIGLLTDAYGNAVQFTLPDESGHTRALGNVRSCYCNDCGEVTLTLE